MQRTLRSHRVACAEPYPAPVIASGGDEIGRCHAEHDGEESEVLGSDGVIHTQRERDAVGSESSHRD